MWFHYLVPQVEKNNKALFDYFELKGDGREILIKDEYYGYTILEDYIKLFTLQQKLPEEKRTIFEIISKKSTQKPYFDIDIEKDLTLEEAKKLIIDFKNDVKKILDISKYNAKILVLSSHSEEKISFHIIIDGIYFKNNEENMNFFNKVAKDKKFFDSSMYKSIQNFRILGSHKKGSNRILKYDEELSEFDCCGLEGIKKDLFIFGASLITNTRECVYCPLFHVEKEIKKIDYNIDVDEEEYDKIISLTLEKVGEIFTVDKILDHKDGFLMVMKRKKGCKNYCFACNREHENENPFVFIIGDERHIYFDCRRNSEGRRVYIGMLGKKLVDETEITFENLDTFKPKQKPFISESDKMKNLCNKFFKNKNN